MWRTCTSQTKRAVFRGSSFPTDIVLPRLIDYYHVETAARLMDGEELAWAALLPNLPTARLLRK